MKRFFLLMVSVVIISASVSAMSYNQAWREAQYLTDKMMYELGLSGYEYDRVYRINLLYFQNLHRDAGRYSSAWRARNSALKALMERRAWNRYKRTSYFYRPVSWHNGRYVHHVYAYYPRQTSHAVVVHRRPISSRHVDVPSHHRRRNDVERRHRYGRGDRYMHHSNGRKNGHYKHHRDW